MNMTPDDFRAAIGDMEDVEIELLMMEVADDLESPTAALIRQATRNYRRSLSTEGCEDAVEMARRKA